MTIREIAYIVQGNLVAGQSDALASGLVVDSQKVKPGDIFVAFAGKTTNGHRFVPDALARGATAVFVTEDIPIPSDSPVAVIKVDNPLSAIHRLALHERNTFSGPVIGVTGSNGKTTTKEMLARVFSTQGDCLFTEGNMNTELGLPLTVLRRTASHRSIVLEMGMRGLGQIEELCSVAKPNAGIITNIGQSHMELLGSQENIARAKSELLQSLPSTGYAALPIADPWLRTFAHKSKARVLWYGIDDEGRGLQADGYPERGFARATALRSTSEGMCFTALIGAVSTAVRLSTFGRHNVLNALGALTLGTAHGLSLTAMAESLSDLKATDGRLNVQSGKRGITVIDDCYNASPLSMKASLDVLCDIRQNNQTAIAILGDMYELGAFAESGHREVGRYTADIGVDVVLAVGPMAQWIAEEAARGGISAHHVETQEQALSLIQRVVSPNSVVLVKASRGMELERIVRELV